jgi:polyhydroxyalkanoate synthesis regulator phasin
MTDIKDLQQQIETLRAEHEAQIQQVVEENEHLRDCIESHETEIEQLNETIDELKTDKERLVGRVDKLEATCDQAVSETEQLEGRVDELESRVDDLEAQPTVSIDDENDPVGSLEIGAAPVGRVLTAKASKSDVEWVEAEIEDLETELISSNPTQETAQSTEQPADVTHIEKISRAAGDDISSVTDSVVVRRAVALWRNLSQWGKKTPKGYCLRPADNPKQLLEADQDESLAWKQYYRAAEALEGLSEGAVTFCHSDRHGKMLVLHEQSDAFDRVQSSLTVSSARAEG